MGLWGDILGTALGGIGLGLPLAHFWGDLTKSGSANPLAPAPKPTKAGDIKLPDADLSSIFQDIGGKAKGTIGKFYGNQKDQLKADARGPRTGGMDLGPNSYAGNRLGTGQKLSEGALESSLGGQLGDTGYQDWKEQRDYEQNKQIATAVGDASKRSILDQALGGIGSVGKAGGELYGAFGGKKAPKTPRYPSIPTFTNDWAFDPYGDMA